MEVAIFDEIYEEMLWLSRAASSSRSTPERRRCHLAPPPDAVRCRSVCLALAHAHTVVNDPQHLTNVNYNIPKESFCFSDSFAAVDVMQDS